VETNLPQTPTTSYENQFQGRYIIRHPWEGPVTCAKPQFGMWGGPPSGGAPAAQPAQDLAFAPRGGIQLAAFVAGDVSQIGLSGTVPRAGSFAHRPSSATNDPLIWLSLLPPLSVLLYIWVRSRQEKRR
jgi:hypothetical protein